MYDKYNLNFQIVFNLFCIFFCSSLKAEWTTPVTLSQITANQPNIAVDQSGNATAVWQAYDGSNYFIQAATLPFSENWSSPVSLSSDGKYVHTPQIALDYAGNATAVWVYCDGKSSVIQGSTSLTSNLWSPPINLSNPSENSDRPNLAISNRANGNGVAVWHHFNGTNFLVQGATYTFGSEWSAPLNISASGNDALFPSIAVNQHDHAATIFSSTSVPIAATRLYGQKWSPSFKLSEIKGKMKSPKITLDNKGNAVAVWSRFNGINYVIQSAILPFGGSWTTPVDISSLSDDAFSPIIKSDGSGNTIAAWIQFDGTHYIVQTAKLPFGGNWTPPINLSSLNRDAKSISLAINDAGNAFAAWDETDGTSSTIWGTLLPERQSVNISTPSKYAFSPTVCIDSTGNVVVIWVEGTGPNTAVKGSQSINSNH